MSNVKGGPNIAMKVPPERFAATLAFYRDTLGLRILKETAGSVAFEYGPIQLWIDRRDEVSHAEVWLELVTPDTAGAARDLAADGVIRRDEIERLPEGFDGFWITSPAGVIHLVSSESPEL